MTVDSSALVAILFAEVDHLRLVDAILEAPVARIGTPTLVETGLVLTGRRRRSAARELTRLVDELGIVAVSFTEDHYREALRAFQKYGRGRHKAGLNFGDCLSYAVASLADEALLFVGDDFTHTDLDAAPR